MKLRKLGMKLAAVSLVLAMAAGLVACGAKNEAEPETVENEETKREEEAEPVEIQVFIAASLNTVMTELAEKYNEEHPEVKITFNADSSGTLLTQIEEGYECDIFFSAAQKQMDQELGSFSCFPDLIMMDGGKGQVNVAQRVMENLGLDIPICGMVKDDFHRTRGLYYQNVELPMDERSEGFKLVTRIQDEAHRFAIEYHRSLRTKGQVHSVLDDIEGIGPARRKALMRAFQSLEAIRSASEEELTKVPSMNAASARQVYNFFHGEEMTSVDK